MKKVFRQIAAVYRHRAGGLVFAMLISVSLMPVVLKSVAMLESRNGLPAALVILCDAAAWPVAWLFFAAAAFFISAIPGKGYWQGQWAALRGPGAWLAAVASALDLARSLYVRYASSLAVSGQGPWYLGGMAILILVGSLVLSLLAFWLLVVLASGQQQIPLRRVLIFWIRKPFFILLSTAALIMILDGAPLAYDWILNRLSPYLALSFLEIAAGCIFLSALQWLVLQPLLVGACMLAAKRVGLQESKPAKTHLAELSSPAKASLPAEADPAAEDSRALEASASAEAPAAEAELAQPAVQPQPPPLKRQTHVLQSVSLLLALAIFIASGLFGLVDSNAFSPVESIRQNLEGLLMTEEFMAESGDYAAAASYYRIAQARVLAWKGAVLDAPDAIRLAQELAPADEQVALLAALNQGDSLTMLEQGFFNGRQSQAWSTALLEAYKSAGPLSEEQLQRQADLLRLCILQGFFTRSAILPQDLVEQRGPLAGLLGEMDERLSFGEYYALIARLGKEGGLSRALLLDTLTLAENHPSWINLQYLAMSFGSTWLEDGADYYPRVADAAIRFDDLFMAKVAGKVDTGAIVREKQDVARTLINIREWAVCADFLDHAAVASPDLAILGAACQYALGHDDLGFNQAEAVLKERPEDPQGLYFAAICLLRQKQVFRSLQYAVRLADLVISAELPQETEKLLYQYVLHLTLNDPNAGFTSEAYSTLTESELSQLGSSSLLGHYARAAHLWLLQGRDSASTTLALSELDEVLRLRDNLPRALYIKGALYDEQKQDSLALQYLKQSLALDDMQPTAWYALALLYDRMGQYGAAYMACQKVLLYIPSTDHDVDVFGIAAHAATLGDSLARQLAGG